MARFSALLALAVAALAACEAHPDHANAVDAAQRREFKQAARRTLGNCATSTKTRQLHERTETHRRAHWEELQKKKLEAVAPVLAKNHKVNLNGVTSPKDVDSASLFATKPAAGVLEPDVTEGPFYVAGELVRNDIREDQEGIDLYTEIQIIDVNTCEPVTGLYLDFWHCNSTGVYSGVVSNINGEPTDISNINTTFGRGLAPTNEDGVVRFVTKFPGHYAMRTTHIHVLGNHGGQLLENNTFVGSSVSNVGQIFFDQDLIAQVEATGVYKTNTQPMTTNKEDFIFVDEASTGFDPIVEYVLLGDTVEDGIYAWISIGVDLKHTAEVHNAAKLTANGGVANPAPFNLGEPPFVQFDVASSSRGNDTVVAPVPAATEAAPSYHPIFAFILVAVALVIINSTETDFTTLVASTGVYVAIYSLVYGASLSDAVGLSIVTTTGTGLAVFVENVRLSAKEGEEKASIDWDLLLVLQPSLLIGVIIGVYSRVLVPEWFLSSVLATLLLICGSLLLQASHRRTDGTLGWSINENSSLLDKPATTNDAPAFADAIQKIPMDKLGVLVSVVIGVIVLQAALVVAVPVVLLVYLGYKSYKTTVDTFERQQLPRVQPAEGEMKWSWHVVHTLPVASALGGVIVGLFGLGSDFITRPFVVEAGLSKSVAAVTGPTIVLIAGLLGTLEYLAEGNGNSTFVFMVILLAFAVKLWCEEVVKRFVPSHFRTQSLILLAFAVITLVSGVALAIALA